MPLHNFKKSCNFGAEKLLISIKSMESIKEQIIKILQEKTELKQKAYNETQKAFYILKKILQKVVTEYNMLLKNNNRIMLGFDDRGDFETELKVADDLLIFNMHPNIYEFPRNHEIWRDTYYVDRPLVTYSGIINIYNFLSDSFKYDRLDDLGYLIGRIFVNKDGTFFIEGRRELGFNYPVFDKNKVNEENFKTVIEAAIMFVLKFDLLVPPYSEVNTVTVEIMKERISKSKIKTGKRLGFKYNLTEDDD